MTAQRRTAAPEPPPQKKESEAKGPIWVKCPCPALPPVLEGVLRAEEARVHRGDAPPPAEGPRPALVVLCLGGEEVDREVRKLRTLAPGCPILVFGPSADRQLTAAALKAGARGVLHAGMASEEIARALSLASEGVVVVPEELLIPGLIAKDLSLAQMEILSLSASGLSEARVAKRLSLSRSAVQRHLRGAYEVLGIADEAQAARIFSVGGGGNRVKCGKKQCTHAKIA